MKAISHKLIVTITCLVCMTASISAQVPLQPKQPVLLRSFGRPGQPTNLPVQAPVQSQAAVWAGQLAAQAQIFRGEVNTLPLSATQRMAVGLASDQVVRSANDFLQFSMKTTDVRLLTAKHAPVDAALQNLETVATQLSGNSPIVATALSRLRYADEKLHSVLHPAPPDGNDSLERDGVARLALSLAQQSEALRVILRGDRTLDPALRTFSGTADTLRREVQQGGTSASAKGRFQQLAAQWQAITATLTPLVGRNPTLRLQTARVDSLYRDLEKHLGAAGTSPLPPGIGFLTPSDRALVVGADAGGGPRVRIYHDLKTGISSDFFAYDPRYTGGVHVAVADLNGDGFPDVVTAPGKDHPPLVRIFNGRDLSLLAEFPAYDMSMTLGVNVAATDLTRDGRAIIATAPAEGGGPHVRIFDLAQGKEIDSFFAYDEKTRSGARVALADVNADGLPDLIAAPGPGAGSQVRIFNGRDRKLLSQFDAFDRSWNGGLFVAGADLTKNGRADLLVGQDRLGSGVVRAFDPLKGKLIGELVAFPPPYRSGVRVATYDVTNDGVLDLLCASGPGTICTVRMFDGKSRRRIGDFQPYGPNFLGGAFVAGK